VNGSVASDGVGVTGIGGGLDTGTGGFTDARGGIGGGRGGFPSFTAQKYHVQNTQDAPRNDAFGGVLEAAKYTAIAAPIATMPIAATVSPITK